MKRPYKILLLLLAAVVMAVVVIVANVSRSNRTVSSIEADVRYGSVPPLVTEQTVVDSVVAALPSLPTMRVGDVDRAAVAEAAAHVPYLRKVRVAVTVSGRVVVHAEQRRPIAHLFYNGRELYFDADGAIMPASKVGRCDVLVAGGDFVEPLRPDSLNSQTAALVDVAAFLDSHKAYRGLIDQIYVQRNGIIMMVPKLGNHIVELGSAENLEPKFSNLLTFYRKGMPRAGWDTYSKISLRFDGQVVCTKGKQK